MIPILSKSAAIEKSIHDLLVKNYGPDGGWDSYYFTLDLYDLVGKELTRYGNITVGEFNKAISDMKKLGMLELAHDPSGSKLVYVRMTDAAFDRHQRQQAQKAQAVSQ